MREIQKSVVGSHKFKKMQHSMGLFFDKAGVLRCGGRLKFAPLDFVTKHPILLPQRNNISELIIIEIVMKMSCIMDLRRL